MEDISLKKVLSATLIEYLKLSAVTAQTTPSKGNARNSQHVAN
ncbi:MAG: hypothetical protein TECD_01206 [Hyphomicrobiaceae bacterium hypho_1]